MKWIKYIVLLGALCFVGLAGCNDTSGGATGDQNDPATSGDDDAQMNEQEGEVDTTNADSDTNADAN